MMGWLYMDSLKGFATPKANLEDQFSFENETGASTVIASAMVKMRTWYAAVRQIDMSTGQSQTFAIVCLIDYNRRARDGMIFGYKDMSEHAGPNQAECPLSILALLGPTEHAGALEWRKRSRAHHDRQRRSVPKIGDVVVFADPIRFTDGFESNRFGYTKRGRQTVFTRPDGTGAYCIRNWKSVAWSIVPAIDVSRIAA